ncbi:hypothetical protein D8B26_000963 [Coccidioides posadasii str. Silveira]|uniref:uncharacterized protein n=1 Tax=Coccidioides posadasii (strain RMSCC 757 / Silveira) TaxID=443226 RepID=UPI001BF00FA6|nr:hypothetical protein D8B26_000963 [Coccidioides posadasii str. Silveira]
MVVSITGKKYEIYVAYCKYISDGFIPPGIAEAGSITRSLLLAAVAPKSWLLGFGSGISSEGRMVKKASEMFNMGKVREA